MNTPSIDFLYLSEPDMIAAGVTDMPACVDAMQETFVLLHRGDYRMAGPNSDSHGAMITFPDDSPFPNMPANTPERRLMAMPAYLGGDFGTSGVKWYGSNIANRDKGLPRSILMFMLSDTDTGAPLALMSANLLSAYRTGAVPGVGARLLARPDSRVVGIVGPGVMARTSLAAFVAACPDIETVKIKGRGQGSIDSFRAWAAEEYPKLETIVVDTIEDAVRDSDIVTYCTTGMLGDPSKYPLIVRDWVRPGAFLSMPAMCDLDDAMRAPDVRKVVDNVRLYEAWAEETGYPSHHRIPIIGCKFMDMIHDGAMDRADLVDLGAIAAGAAVGRRSDDEIVLLSVGGMPVEDVAWGTVVYRNAVKRGIGTTLNLWQSPALA
ncbi:ornithine cyclodeaminase [Nocardia tenerifensis]|uniref:Ornithine cyclodeaminase n=1 Tax=Nocardia tenerifensis TaxID=228006 RepID=A0A318KF40_9NOCA|nr:tyramine oxidase subunit B [Nocardia tenerifensis]PXX71449.1 ornithine cyclodeaminase [Nocardia tenerifensis]